MRFISLRALMRLSSSLPDAASDTSSFLSLAFALLAESERAFGDVVDVMPGMLKGNGDLL